MSLSSQLAELFNRLYPRVTVDAGRQLASMPATGSLTQLRRRHMTVVSYRRDGTPIATPVWFAVVDGRVVFRSLAHAHKVRRITRDPRVLVAPCSARGRPVGFPVQGRATVLAGSAAAAAEQALRRRYSLGRRAYRTLTADADAVYLAVEVDAGAERESSDGAPAASRPTAPGPR